MARASSAKNRSAIEQVSIDLIGQFRAAMDTKRPWDSIIDFATHPSFSGLRLYPRQQTLLKLIYLETENMTPYDIEVIEGWRQGFKDPRTPAGVQEDIWERVDFLKANGYTHFPHVQSILGRRASKGMIGGVLGAERLGYMVSLDNPQEHYGIAEGKEMFLHVVATNQEQAKKFLFADVRQAVEQNQWLAQRLAVSKEYRLALRTPNDLRRIADMSSKGLPVDREIASIQAVAMSSNSSSGRGGSAFCVDPETPVLMSDGTEKPIREVAVGESVASVEEEPTEGRRRNVDARVVGKSVVRKPAFKITFEDGTHVICSEDHKWLDGDGNWREARDFQVGDYIEEFNAALEDL